MFMLQKCKKKCENVPSSCYVLYSFIHTYNESIQKTLYQLLQKDIKRAWTEGVLIPIFKIIEQEWPYKQRNCVEYITSI